MRLNQQVPKLHSVVWTVEVQECKSGPQFESMSIQDEMEDNLIEKCVTVDIELGMAMVKLPFLGDLEKHLALSEHIAQNANPEDKKICDRFQTKIAKSWVH